MLHKDANFSAIRPAVQGPFKKKNAGRRVKYGPPPDPVEVKCHFRWKVIIQKVIKYSLAQWCYVPRELTLVRISVPTHLDRDDPNFKCLR